MAIRTPYNADHVTYVHDRGHITAVWVSDPSIPAAEALDNLARRDLPYEVEVIAEATRFYKSEGAAFSGWVITSGRNYSDPIPTKTEAVEHIRDAVRHRFE